jgi:hypothetical protein
METVFIIREIRDSHKVIFYWLLVEYLMFTGTRLMGLVLDKMHTVGFDIIEL